MGLAQIKMPQLGESVTEGTVDHWLKNEGDFVKRDEPIVEVVTDKVNAEIPSPFEGKLVKITAAQGETVLVGSVIAQIEVAGTPSAPAAPAAPAAQGAKPEPKAAAVSGPAVVAAAAPAEVVAAGGGNGGARLSPAVRKLAAEHNLDPTTLRGSGLGGRVTRDDILAAVGGASPAAALTSAPATAPQAPRDGSREELVKLSIMRRSIAEHMVRSLATAPHAWTLQEVDVTNLVRYRESEKEGFKARHGVALTYIPFVVQIVCEAIKQFPWLNSGHRGLDPRRAHRAGPEGCGPARFHRPRAVSRRPDRPRAQQAAQAGRRAGGHVHPQQHRLYRFDRVAADHQPAPGRHPHHGIDSAPARRHRRRDRGPQHDEHVPELRPSHHRRHDGRPVPRLRQEAPRRMDCV